MSFISLSVCLGLEYAFFFQCMLEMLLKKEKRKEDNL